MVYELYQSRTDKADVVTRIILLSAAYYSDAQVASLFAYITLFHISMPTDAGRCTKKYAVVNYKRKLQGQFMDLGHTCSSLGRLRRMIHNYKREMHVIQRTELINKGRITFIYTITCTFFINISLQSRSPKRQIQLCILFNSL